MWGGGARSWPAGRPLGPATPRGRRAPLDAVLEADGAHHPEGVDHPLELLLGERAHLAPQEELLVRREEVGRAAVRARDRRGGVAAVHGGRAALREAREQREDDACGEDRCSVVGSASGARAPSESIRLAGSGGSPGAGLRRGALSRKGMYEVRTSAVRGMRGGSSLLAKGSPSLSSRKARAPRWRVQYSAQPMLGTTASTSGGSQGWSSSTNGGPMTARHRHSHHAVEAQEIGQPRHATSRPIRNNDSSTLKLPNRTCV